MATKTSPLSSTLKRILKTNSATSEAFMALEMVADLAAAMLRTEGISYSANIGGGSWSFRSLGPFSARRFALLQPLTSAAEGEG